MDLDWISSRLSLLQMQVQGLAMGLEQLQQAHSRLSDRVQIMEDRLARKEAHNKCHTRSTRLVVLSLETLDD